jgi:hypothetical protein
VNKLICHANDCDNSTSETFFHCEQHGGEDGEGESLQERADRTNPYLLTTNKEGESE